MPRRDVSLANLRHAYFLGRQGLIADQRTFVEHLLAPAIEWMERDGRLLVECAQRVRVLQQEVAALKAARVSSDN